MIVLAIGFWIIHQFITLFEPYGEGKKTLRSKPAPKIETIPQTPPVPTQAKEEAVEWVKQEYPNALLMDAQTIVKEYKAGRRDFQNVYPTALAPYDTFLKWTVLDGVDFSRAVLYRASFEGTSLLDVNFNGAYLEGASFIGAILRRTNFGWADLTGADFAGADLTNANFSYASLAGANLARAKLTGATITSEQLETVHSLEGTTLPDGSKKP